jgi:hypothetical protein
MPELVPLAIGIYPYSGQWDCASTSRRAFDGRGHCEHFASVHLPN